MIRMFVMNNVLSAHKYVDFIWDLFIDLSIVSVSYSIYL